MHTYVWVSSTSLRDRRDIFRWGTLSILRWRRMECIDCYIIYRAAYIHTHACISSTSLRDRPSAQELGRDPFRGGTLSTLRWRRMECIDWYIVYSSAYIHTHACISSTSLRDRPSAQELGRDPFRWGTLSILRWRRMECIDWYIVYSSAYIHTHACISSTSLRDRPSAQELGRDPFRWGTLSILRWRRMECIDWYIVYSSAYIHTHACISSTPLWNRSLADELGRDPFRRGTLSISTNMT